MKFYVCRWWIRLQIITLQVLTLHSICCRLPNAVVWGRSMPRAARHLPTPSQVPVHELRGGGGRDSDGRVFRRPRRTTTPAVHTKGTRNPQKMPTSSLSKWHNVKERTGPAVGMAVGVAGWLRYWGMTRGISSMIVLLQIGLYQEVCTVVGIRQGFWKWWWMGTVMLGTTGRAVVSRVKTHRIWEILSEEQLNLLCYGMAVVSLLGFVVQQNAPDTTPDQFQRHLGQLAASHFTLLISIVQSSCWLGTLFEFGWEWVLFPAGLVIVNDTMAYVFGMLFGRHALLPVISPKKTWEGFLGAWLSTMLVSQPLWDFLQTPETTTTTTTTVASTTMAFPVAVIALFVSFISPFGGFLASITKRAYDKKDFATYLPGHGGVVDRFDCQVVTAPFVYLFLKAFW